MLHHHIKGFTFLWQQFVPTVVVSTDSGMGPDRRYYDSGNWQPAAKQKPRPIAVSMLMYRLPKFSISSMHLSRLSGLASAGLVIERVDVSIAKSGRPTSLYKSSRTTQVMRCNMRD